MDYPWAVPGAKVVCIKRGPWSNGWTEFFGVVAPTYGQVLTIRAVGIGSKGPTLLFDEVRNPKCGVPDPFDEPSFGVRRFRPLVSLKDDLAKFTHLLNTQKIEERA